MKKRMARLTALVLAVCVCFSGCALDFRGLYDGIVGLIQTNSRGENREPTRLSEIPYVRPEPERLQSLLEKLQSAAEAGNLGGLINAYNALVQACDQFYTRQAVAQLHYDMDLTDTYWAEESQFCTGMASQVSSILEDAYRAMAASPLRETLEGEDYFGAGAFDGYDGEKRLSDEILSLMDRESELQDEYYTLSSQAAGLYGEERYDAVAQPMAEVLVELVSVRRALAAACGYDSYAAFVYENDYYRDYTPEQVSAYLDEIAGELSGIYRQVAERGESFFSTRYFPEKQTLLYVKNAVNQMGGEIAEAYSFLEAGELYDLTYSPNKYQASYEIYLSEYEEPFILMNPEQTEYDCLTFSHEFGHFAADYVSMGAVSSIDIQEVMSQAMEYLTLAYSGYPQRLTRGKLSDSLGTYVEQAFYASFEAELYTRENLTAADVFEIYAQQAEKFGLASEDLDPRELVTITHFYTNPMYIVSYIVSNDAAMDIFRMEQSEPGSGLTCYTQAMDIEEDSLLAFLAAAGLESPFTPGRLKTVGELFTSALLS